MNDNLHISAESYHTAGLNNYFFAILLFSLLPMLALLGFNLAPQIEPFNIEQLSKWQLSTKHLHDEMYYALNGGVIHALLEWSAVVIAAVCIVIAIGHYRISGDITAPLLGIALLFSGLMDAIHTLAATRLIDAIVANDTLVPFSWAVSRGFNAFILLSGGIFLIWILKKDRVVFKSIYLIIIPIVIILVIIGMSNWMLTTESLPQTQFSDSVIRRPFDVIPLLIFIACIPIFIKLYRMQSNFLSMMLVLSLIPEICSEAYMAFGSERLFDHYFNSAHILKILAYSLPCIGYIMDYRAIFLQQSQREKEQIQINKKLQLSNQQLERFAYICSHDLQEPARTVHSFSQILAKRIINKLDDKEEKYLQFIMDGANRSREMINDMLIFSRLDQCTDSYKSVSLITTLNQVQDTLQIELKEKSASLTWDIHGPDLLAAPSQIYQLFLNLIHNGIKFNKSCNPAVYVKSTLHNHYLVIDITDNGIGISPKHHKAIFNIFERLHSKQEYPGTGIGLASCHKIVEQYGASIEIDSTEGNGCTFIIKWPLEKTTISQQFSTVEADENKENRHE